MGWLISSISSDLFSLVLGCHSVNEMWESLKTYFISESKVKISNLRNTLQTFRKGNLSIQEYMMKIKDIFDTLVSSGQTITKKMDWGLNMSP